jgi:endonuclease I/V8-like Glu-specific endopeptidase
MNPEHRERLLGNARALLSRSAPGVESAGARRQRPAFDARDEEILDRIANHRPLSDDDAFRTEAIILPKLRPVFDIAADSFEDLPAPWDVMNGAAARLRIRQCIRAVGRIDIPGHPRLAYGGTGFLVAPNLLLTNRHVAAIFTTGIGVRNLKLTFQPRVDLKQEAASEESILLSVANATLIHPYWDAALLTVSGVPDDLTPLALASDAAPGDRLIAVIGYPAFDPRNNRQVQREVFHDLFEKKRLQPGYVTGARAITSFGHDVEAATHDASTLGGNSGSAVIDVDTGQVLGLHFAGVYLDTNYAVPAWELARDPKLVDLGVRFANPIGTLPPSPPDWLAHWRWIEERTHTPAPVPPAPTHEHTWTIPIQVTVRVGAPAPTAPPPVAAADPLSRLREARRRIAEDPANYYPDAEDRVDAATYYSGIPPDASSLFQSLNRLLTATHTHQLPYRPATHLYPLIDLQPDGDLLSIYSETSMDPEELIRAESPLELALDAALASGASESAIAAVEALQQNSAEHVVPQSWFNAKQPMRGDLHHLFACERGCNSFRGNTAFWEFGPVEKVMEDCGRSERAEDKFEPKGGKGAVARATLYFLVRYPGKVQLPAGRLPILLRWHNQNSVSLYERHRNREIFLKQGNRNPFIDHPEWAGVIDFGMH